jgi:hypothetical protein
LRVLGREEHIMTTTPTLWKSEMQVNITEGFDGQVVPLRDGGYVIVWTNLGGADIVGQKFDAAGNKVGGEVALVGAGLEPLAFEPAVTTLANGQIAVAFAYVGFVSDGFGNVETGIAVRIFNPALGLVRTDFLAVPDSSQNLDQNLDPSIAALTDGGYMVSYTHPTREVGSGAIAQSDIVANIVSPTGVVGGQFDVFNQDNKSGLSELATLSDGNVVAVYQDHVDRLSLHTDILYTIFKPDGAPLQSGLVPGAGDADGREARPDVAALRDGGFVVIWTDNFFQARASILSNTGTPVASDIWVNTEHATLVSDDTRAGVVALADGGFLVTFDVDDGTLQQWFAQRFDATGHKIGDEVLVKRFGADLSLPEPTSHAEVAVLADGRIAYALDATDVARNLDVETSIWTTKLADGHVHDFDGDGTGDVLWQHDNGGVGIWELDSGQVIASAGLRVGGPDRHVAGTGDFNGDAKSDILWRNDNGATGIWELDGTGVIGVGSPGQLAPEWKIADTADFNGDGTSDILWHNDNGATGIWELDGTQVIGVGSVGQAAPEWKIAGTGDFNRDGTSDILWRHDNGAVGVWELDGTQVIGTASLGTAGPDWHVMDTGDFNGDGADDILWRNDNGAVGLWELKDGQVIATASLGTAGTDWNIVA